MVGQCGTRHSPFLSKIYCLKFPSKCINLAQYVGILKNLAGKFPFVQVYNYDKDFRQQMEQESDLPWLKIDQQLWSMSLHGIHTINQAQQPQWQRGRQQRQSFQKKQDWPFRHCFDHSRGAATGSHAVFHTYADTVEAPITQPTTAPHAKTILNSTTAQQGSSKAVQPPKGIPSTEQYVPPMPLKVDHLWVVLQQSSSAG